MSAETCMKGFHDQLKLGAVTSRLKSQTAGLRSAGVISEAARTYRRPLAVRGAADKSRYKCSVTALIMSDEMTPFPQSHTQHTLFYHVKRAFVSNYIIPR